MDESKKGFLPILQGKTLRKSQSPTLIEEREKMNNILYASAICSIICAMMCMKTDVAHVVSLTNRYQRDLETEHWTSVKKILKYLKRTKGNVSHLWR
jgi:hypothetical protein